MMLDNLIFWGIMTFLGFWGFVILRSGIYGRDPNDHSTPGNGGTFPPARRD